MAGTVQQDRRGSRVVVVYCRLNEDEHGWVERIMADERQRTISDAIRICIAEAARRRGYSSPDNAPQETA